MEILTISNDDEQTSRGLLLSCRSKFEINEIRKNVGKRIKDLYTRSYFFQLSSDCLRYIEALEKVGVHANNIEQVSNWIKAEADGRLVVLPCKVGTRIWYEEDGEIVWGNFDYDCINALGTCVFLTCEEAEAALKGENTNET